MAANLNIFTINQPHIPDFTNPLGLLVHCHERIESQLSALERAGDILRAGDGRSLSGASAAIDMACAHFAIAGVKHTEDEDVSLFPRLRERGGSAGQDALAAITELESQHRTAEHLHAELDELVRRLPRDGSADVKELDRYSEMVSELTTLYRPHIFLENNFVFPVAARVLPASEILELGEEMRARRKDILQKLEVAR
ncbi:MAG TPA: hemerythrin domain-containing protein [Pyrinomonadaceae bacterium]|jgi:hemerythrin-like domain-containing protein|nr:hemerythrin domain-containing protein [Pyrinomonadaceae bacterium]